MRLPPGWTTSTIEMLTELVSRGRTPSYIEASDFPVVNQRSIRWTGVEERHLKFVDPTTRQRWSLDLFLREGDILWNSTGTGTIGRAALFRGLTSFEHVVLDSHVTLVRTNHALDPHYLFALIRSPRVQHTIEDMQSGSTNQVELSRSAILATEVPLPPLSEQRRIVAKLYSLTAHIIRAREHLSSVVRRAEQLREATLGDVFSQIVSDARLLPFSDKLSLLTSGSRDWAKFYDRGSSVFVLAGNVRSLAFDPKPRRLVDPPLDGPDARRSKVLKDDLLITIVGAGTGDICRVPDHYPNYFVCQSVARAVLRDTRLAAFYAYWFVSPSHGRADFEAAMYGAARPHLSFDQIQNFMVPDVSMTVAAEAVARIEAAFARAGRLEAEAARAAALLNRLESSILARAFRGELVPQDPADEPASALLDRISAGRSAAPKVRRGRGAARHAEAR